MALTEQEKELVQKLKAQGKTGVEIAGAIGGLRTGQQGSVSIKEPEKYIQKSRFSDIGGDIKETYGDIKNNISTAGINIANQYSKAQTGERNPVLAGLDIGGSAIGAVSNVGGNLFMGASKSLLAQNEEDAIKKKAIEIITPVAQNPQIQNVISYYSGLDENTKQNLRTSGNIGMGLVDLLTMGTAKSATTPLKNIAGQAVDTASGLVDNAITTGAKLTDKIVDTAKQSISKPVTPEKAVGQVLRDKTLTPSSEKTAIETIKQLDTNKVKTFQDLNNVIKEKIPELIKKVDEDLAQDTTKYSLDQLSIKKQTKAGGEVVENYIENALNQLDELYTKTGDLVKSQDIKDLLQAAKTQGLTRQEVNDIARAYGSEFGSKAFNKMGDPLTSVNAQLYENTRKGLKDVARAGLNGAEAKQADKLVSRLINIQELVQKNIEKVNDLTQRIQDRGLLEKIGNNLSKYADILTGGSIRGIIGGLLPRGAGYKVMNALDLEAVLQKNLKIIQEAGKAKSVNEFKSILNKLGETKPVAKPPIQFPRKKKIPNRQGGFIKIGNKTIKEITETTKDELWESIKFLKGEKSSITEKEWSKLAQKFEINEDQPLNSVIKRIETILDKTKTKSVLPKSKLYHGSDKDFAAFDLTKAKTTSNYGQGIYFSDNPKLAEYYSTIKTKKADLSKASIEDLGNLKTRIGSVKEIELVPNAKIKTLQENPTQSMIAKAKADGFDGVKFKDTIVKEDWDSKVLGEMPEGGNTTLIFNEKALKQPTQSLPKSKVNESVSSLNDSTLIKEAKNPTLDNLNPTGGLFVDYTPEARMNMKLGNNITTLANTMKKSPDTPVTIYRGTINSQKSINAGDFITTDYELAKSYGDNVISKQVKLGDVLDDIESPKGGEYLYRPNASKELSGIKYDYTKSDWYKNYVSYLSKNKEKFKTLNEWVDGMKASGKTKFQLEQIWKEANKR